MKLDATVMRTMSKEDFRVLQAVETAMQDHALVPMPLIHAVAQLRRGGSHKIVSSLLRDKLLSHEVHRKHGGGGVDGYRLTNSGYDILALHHLKTRGLIAALGQKVGTGKESDIYLAVQPSGRQVILKLHRLGRTSFRNVRKKRDYFGGTGSTHSSSAQRAHSWLFLSRLSALKEYAFMKALHEVQYPTPVPMAHNRHIVMMSLVRGMPLYQIMPHQVSAEQAADIYQQAVGIAARLARHHGLVHCDLNEFNLLVDLSGIQALSATPSSSDPDVDPYVRHSGKSVTGGTHVSVGALSRPAWEQSLDDQGAAPVVPPEPAARLENGEPKPVVILIDFPQMISIQHPNAQEYYERDLGCLHRFFAHKWKCHIPAEDIAPFTWEQQVMTGNSSSSSSQHQLIHETTQQRLDAALRASGFNDSMAKSLELYYFETNPSSLPISENFDDDDEEEEEDEEGEEDEEDNSQDRKEDADNDVNDNISNDDGYDEKCADGAAESMVDDRLLEAGIRQPSADSDELNAREREDDDLASYAPSVNTNRSRHKFDVMSQSDLRSISREQLVDMARERVRRQLEADQKKDRRRQAFKSGNSNKNYVKGKRILTDSGL